jgi:hypothetical protein
VLNEGTLHGLEGGRLSLTPVYIRRLRRVFGEELDAIARGRELADTLPWEQAKPETREMLDSLLSAAASEADFEYLSIPLPKSRGGNALLLMPMARA